MKKIINVSLIGAVSLFALCGDTMAKSVAKHLHQRSKVKQWKSEGSKIPVHPISHYKDGKMKIGTADAWGTK